MNNQMNTYEKKGTQEYLKKGWVWKAVMCADELYHLLANNQDEIPSVVYSEMYQTIKGILDIKYSLLELIGRDSK